MSQEEQLGFEIEGMASPRLKAQAVREELEGVLDRVRTVNSDELWTRDEHAPYLRLLTEKASVLPPDEAEFMRRQLTFEFERIEQRLAA